MLDAKDIRKKNINVSVEDLDIGIIYIAKVINNGQTLEPVLRFIKENKEIKNLCQNSPDVVVKINNHRYNPSEIWDDL